TDTRSPDRAQDAGERAGEWSGAFAAWRWLASETQPRAARCTGRRPPWRHAGRGALPAAGGLGAVPARGGSFVLGAAPIRPAGRLDRECVIDPPIACHNLPHPPF